MKQESWSVYAMLGACTVVSAFHFAPLRYDSRPLMPELAGVADVRPQRDVDAEVDAQIQWLHDALHDETRNGATEGPALPQTDTAESTSHPGREI